MLGLGWAEEAPEAGAVGEESLKYASSGEGTSQTGQRAGVRPGGPEEIGFGGD